MTEYRLVAEPRVDLDVAATYQWYENEQPGLGLEFLDQLRSTYDRIAARPFQYQDLRSGIRRALLRRFPYAVYSQWKAISSSSSRFCTRVGTRPSGSGDVSSIWLVHDRQWWSDAVALRPRAVITTPYPTPRSLAQNVLE